MSIDGYLEVIRTAVVLLIVIILLRRAATVGVRERTGLKYIIAGFIALLFGSFLDITENFPSLNRFIILGDTTVEAYLETMVGNLLGFILIAIGLWKLIPVLKTERKIRTQLDELNQNLETTIAQRTEELYRANEQLLKVNMELVESEEFTRVLIDEAPSCIKTLDRRGCLLSMNTSGLVMIEADNLAQVQGAKMSDLVDQAYRQEFIQLIKDVFAGNAGTLLFKAKGLKGSKIWLETHATPLFDPENNIINLLGITLNVTDRMEAMAEHERIQRELQQAQKMEALGLLTGGIAHDFNNLLGIIIGNTQLAQLNATEDVLPKRNKNLKNILQASNRASELVAQMLTFSRGDSTIDKTQQLASLIEQDVSLLRSSLPASIDIKINITEDLPRVQMNAIQFNQMLMNLAINAKDAIAEKRSDLKGEMIFSLKWARNLNAECLSSHQQIKGDWIEVSVADNGIGMEPEILHHIFDPFFTTKDVTKGTGLGLSVIQGIISKRGGHILIDSVPGEGTTFRLLFKPVNADKEVNRPATTIIEEIEEIEDIEETNESSFQTATSSNVHIMVVDDEPTLTEFLSELLEVSGYQVTCWTDSNDVARLSREELKSYDLIITDQTMPGISGIELVTILRKKCPDFPVVLMTGYSEQIDEEKASDINIGFLRKPTDSSLLLQTVKTLLDQ